MYNENEENLFGWDMRHRPPITILPTEEHGWDGSHGRLAYSKMNRSQERNYSEYAITTMGVMPKNYIIVNVNEAHINNETAFKVCHNRMAIPVKEFAKQKKLSLKEQWELMNPQWIGTYFNNGGIDQYRNRRPTLERAMKMAMEEDRFDEFMQQFWSAKYGHQKAVERLEKRARDLDSRANSLDMMVTNLRQKVNRIQDDINGGRLKIYHLQGYNVHEYLNETRAEYNEVLCEYTQCRNKARRIKEYINSITY